MNSSSVNPPDIAPLTDALDHLAQALGRPTLTLAGTEAIRRRLTHIAGSDAKFRSDLIDLFILRGHDLIRDLQAAASSGHSEELAATARSLKEASDELHVRGLALLAFGIETRAKFGAHRDWNADVQMLSVEFGRVERLLTALKAAFNRSGAG